MSETDHKSLGARLAPWVATAAVAVLALWLTTRVLALRTENQSLRTERMLAEVAYKLGQNQLAERTLLAENMINDLSQKLRHAEQLERLKICALLPPTGGIEGGRAVMVWDQEPQAGLLTAENLRSTPPGQAYRIWITDPASAEPVSGGIFQAGADGRAVFAFHPAKPVSGIAGWSVTLADNDGIAKTPGPVVLSGK